MRYSIRPGWKGLLGTNILSYFVIDDEKKSFMILPPQAKLYDTAVLKIPKVIPSDNESLYSECNSSFSRSRFGGDTDPYGRRRRRLNKADKLDEVSTLETFFISSLTRWHNKPECLSLESFLQASLIAAGKASGRL
jgi:hypothetical protein